MTDFTLLHHKDPTFRTPAETDGSCPVSVTLYEAIAIVEAESLDELFEKTNHIDSDWTGNDGIRMLGKRNGHNTRSTSVGDLVLNMDTMELMICKSSGWGKAHWTG